MFIYQFDYLHLVSDDFVADYLLSLPSERRERCERYRNQSDKKACIMAYLLLEAGLKERCGITSFSFVYNKYGKPYLKDQNIYFNISHCRNSVVCVIADFEVGVDIEYIRDFDINLARRICTENEIQQLTESENPAKLFCRFWTEKESCAKSLGISVAGIFKTELTAVKFITWEREDYCLTICSRNENK